MRKPNGVIGIFRAGGPIPTVRVDKKNGVFFGDLVEAPRIPDG